MPINRIGGAQGGISCGHAAGAIVSLTLVGQGFCDLAHIIIMEVAAPALKNAHSQGAESVFDYAQGEGELRGRLAVQRDAEGIFNLNNLVIKENWTRPLDEGDKPIIPWNLYQPYTKEVLGGLPENQHAAMIARSHQVVSENVKNGLKSLPGRKIAGHTVVALTKVAAGLFGFTVSVRGIFPHKGT